MATNKIQLNGIRIRKEVHEDLQRLHIKHGKKHRRTKNRQSFSTFVEDILKGFIDRQERFDKRISDEEKRMGYGPSKLFSRRPVGSGYIDF